MTSKVCQNGHRGSDFLAGEGILAEVEVLAHKRALPLQLQQSLEQEYVTKTEMASRMKPA